MIQSASITTVEQIVKQEKIDCGFNRTGHLVVANKASHFEAFQSEAEWLAHHFGHKNARLVTKSELHNEIGSDAYYGGLVDETSAGLNPAQYVVGLAKASERAGAVLCSRARLTQIEKLAKGFQLKTNRGVMVASQVVVTTGGYTGKPTPKLQRRIIPIGSYVIATQILPKSLAQQLNPHNRMIFRLQALSQLLPPFVR